MSLADFKKAFPRSPHLIHLNNAGLAPTSAPARDIVHHWVERFHQEGMHCNDDYLAAMEVTRTSLAKIIGCKNTEVAFFQSTAGAVSQMAFGLPLSEGDEIIVWDQEYSSNFYPWQETARRHKARLVVVGSGPAMETPVEKMIAAITPKTKVIALSWVQFQTGAITDIAPLTKIAREKNIWTVVDVIQGLGMMPFDYAALDVDAVCGGSHKWLCSPVGVGYLAIKEERVKEIRPLMIGSGTYGTCEDPTTMACIPKDNAWKFEAGSRQVLEILALGASVDLILKTGLTTIQHEVESLAMKLRQGLQNLGYQIHTPHGAQQKGAAVNFSRGPLAPTEKLLQDHHISFARRGPGLRLSPHAFNTDQDIEAVLQALR